MLKKSRQNFTSLHVDADAIRAETDPKVFTAIKPTFRVAGKSLDPAAVERAVKLSKENIAPQQQCSEKRLKSPPKLYQDF